jgi:hypothetical protein
MPDEIGIYVSNVWIAYGLVQDHGKVICVNYHATCRISLFNVEEAIYKVACIQ